MHFPSKALAVTLAAGIVALCAVALDHSTASAYGAADHPLAQIEFSGNCNNPDFFFCAPPPEGVGTGGIWLWLEIDSGGTGDVSGAVCGHVVGGIGGPGGAGAQSIRTEITWVPELGVPDPSVFGEAALPGMADPNGDYYLVSIPDQDAPGGSEQFLFPQTPGHYSFNPVPGVTLQLQVAP
jgi:hypothetical protein